MVHGIFGGLLIVVGVVNLVLQAGRGELLATPFRRDWWNGPGLGAFLAVAGAVELWLAISKARGRKPA